MLGGFPLGSAPLGSSPSTGFSVVIGEVVRFVRKLYVTTERRTKLFVTEQFRKVLHS